VSVVFGEHSSITELRARAFQNSFALTSITLPNNLKVIEKLVFGRCSALERVVCNKNLKTIGDYAFQNCSKLEDVQLASSSTSFGRVPFIACDRLIELADAAGFVSNTFGTKGERRAEEMIIQKPAERSKRARRSTPAGATIWHIRTPCRGHQHVK